MDEQAKQKPSDIILSMLTRQLNKKPEDVKPSMRLKEALGADSLDLVELTMEIEDKYGISVPHEEAILIKTVNDLIAYVEKTTSQSS